jgi:hypothetical protein
MRNAPLALCLLACLLPPATIAGAESLPDDLIRAELLPGWRTEAGTQMAALRVTLAPGWKTYWRSPGDAGIPPEFDWTGSENVGAVRFHWPRPQVFDLNGYRTLAYADELVLPIEFVPADPGASVRVTSRIRLGVCEEVCVPVSVSVSADLSPGAEQDPAIAAALAIGPDDGRALGLPKPHCSAEPIRDGVRLTSDIGLPGAGAGDFAVVELDDRAVWVADVESRAAGGRLVQVSDLVPAEAKPFALDRSAVRLTVFTTQGDVIELRGCAG